MKHVSICLMLCVGLAACSKKDKTDNANEEPAAGSAAPPAAEPPKADEPAAPPKAEEPPAPAAAENALLKQLGFANVAADGVVGEFALAPNDSSMKSAVEGAEHEKNRVSYGVITIAETGPAETKVKGMGAEWMVPNALIVPIPKEVEVAVGDLVVASRYGNNFDHAIITEAGAPPKANFMRTMPYTKEHTAALKPNQFIKLDGTEWQPGSLVAYKNKGTVGWEVGAVIRATGDALLVLSPTGDLRVATKAEAKPVPLKPDVKKGATVFGVWDSVHFSELKLEKIDAKLGVYTVRKAAPFDKDAKYTPFGMMFAEALPE